MAILKEKIKEDINKALKRGNQEVVSTLRFFLSAVQNKEIALNSEKGVSNEQIIEILFSEIKKRKDSILEFEKGKRQDLADKEKAEVEILKKYLPEQATEEEIRKIVEQAIEKTKARTIKDMGKVMAEVSLKLKGRAEGGLISRIAREKLTG
jgi:uncharacterized protein